MKKVTEILAALAVTLCFATGALADKIGKFEVKDAGGVKFTQEQLKGKKAVLAFVQAACGQCRTEIADLTAKADAITGKAELFIVVVDVNTERAMEYFKSQNVPGKLLADPDFKMGAAAGVGATPSTVVLNKELNIVTSKTGYRAGDVEKLISEL